MADKFDYVKTRREDIFAIPKALEGLFRFIVKTYMRYQIWVYKKTRGRMMNTLPGGYEICIVGMTGRKSGQRREIALVHLSRGENKYLVASQGGMAKHPLWYFNVVANPDIDIRVKAETRKYRTRQLTADEKRECWPYLVAIYPDYDEYQARTDRDIPVFIAEPF